IPVQLRLDRLLQALRGHSLRHTGLGALAGSNAEALRDTLGDSQDIDATDVATHVIRPGAQLLQVPCGHRGFCAVRGEWQRTGDDSWRADYDCHGWQSFVPVRRTARATTR